MSSADISRERRALVYQWWEEDNANLPAEHPGLDVTYDRCAEYAARLATVSPARDAAKRYTALRVMDWLQHPEKHSPNLDMVAISRALDFDWPVLRNLTRDESSYVVHQLAKMDDPWGLDEDPLSAYLRRLSFTTSAPSLATPTPRRIRFHSGTPGEQRRLIDRVNAQRARNMAVAA